MVERFARVYDSQDAGRATVAEQFLVGRLEELARALAQSKGPTLKNAADLLASLQPAPTYGHQFKTSI